MKKTWIPLLLAFINFSGFLALEVSAQETPISSYSNISSFETHSNVPSYFRALVNASEEAVTELRDENGVKEITIDLNKVSLKWMGKQEVVLNMPLIQLSLQDHVIFKIKPPKNRYYQGDGYFFFNKEKSDLSILKPTLNDSNASYGWNQEPFDASSWAWWHWPYFKSWTAIAPGSTTLSFYQKKITGDNVVSGKVEYVTIIHIPIEVVE